MKRVRELGGAVLAAAALCISSAAFVPTAANAAASGPSTWCTDGVGGETVVTNSPIALAVEVSTFDWPDGPHNLAMVCWSTTPRGSTAPEANGGAISIWTHPDGTTTAHCTADRGPATVVAVDCANVVSPTDPNPSSAGLTVTGSFQEGPTSPIFVDQTGAETGDVNARTSGPTMYRTDVGGACLWVVGTQIVPGCASRTVDLYTHTFLLMETNTGTSGTQCIVHNGSSCVVGVPRYYQEVGTDPSNPLLTGQVAGVPVDLDMPYHCVGLC